MSWRLKSRWWGSGNLFRKYSHPQYSVPDCWPVPPRILQTLRTGFYASECGMIPLQEMEQYLAPATAADAVVSLQTFDVLRALKAVGDNNSRRLARRLVSVWIAENGGKFTGRYWLTPAWRPDWTGYRLANWVGFYDFFAQSADERFQKRMLKSLTRQFHTLRRRLKYISDPWQRFHALKGLLICALVFKPFEKYAGRFLALLKPCAELTMREPFMLLLALRDWLDLRNALRIAKISEPDYLREAVNQLAPRLRFFRHGDGMLSDFGADDRGINQAMRHQLCHEALIDMTLSLADNRLTLPPYAQEMGYVRTLHKAGTLIINSEPRSHAFDEDAPGGRGSEMFRLEWSKGRNRIMPLCDVIIQDENGEEYKGTLTKPADLRFAVNNDHQAIEGTACYRNLTYMRCLYLSPLGELKGEDTLRGTDNFLVAVRFIFSPQVRFSENSPSRAGSYLSIGKQEWQFIADGHQEVVREMWHDRPVLILLNAVAAGEERNIKWAFRPLTEG